MSKIEPDVSVVVTVLNESETITSLLESLDSQSLPPAEIVIVDGGSSDDTTSLIDTFKDAHSKIKILSLQKKGNRSIGRNFGIEKSSNEVIAITDAGCEPQKNWLEELLRVYKEKKPGVVAGYYEGLAHTNFEEAVIPYALVMPDKVNEKLFLPATRSMLLEKTSWKSVGGFNERLSDNEDYDFALRLREAKVPISFAKKAIVIWKPRANLQDFFWMILRFARGDIQAKIVRPKVILLFFRYLSAVVLLFFLLKFFSLSSVLVFFVFLGLLYSLWAIQKNLKYVPRGWYWLPVLQFTADCAVIVGSVQGLFR